MTEQIESVAPRQPGEIRRCLGDEGRGLIRPALSTRFLGSRTSLRVFGRALWAALDLGQKITSKPCIFEMHLFQERNYRAYFMTFQLVIGSHRAPPQHLSI